MANLRFKEISRYTNSHIIYNLNPLFLLESDEIIQAETKKICGAMKNFPGFIFNLGHGITPDIKPEKVQVMIDAVRT